MQRYVWNKVEKCRVPFNRRLDVDGNPNLEWRQEDETSQHVVDEGAETAAPVIPGMSLMDAIALLNPADVTHWTKAGLPDANALSELTGRKVSATERNDAWAEYQEKKG